MGSVSQLTHELWLFFCTKARSTLIALSTFAENHYKIETRMKALSLAAQKRPEKKRKSPLKSMLLVKQVLAKITIFENPRQIYWKSIGT